MLDEYQFPKYEFHELADLFPLMDEKPFGDLVEDIRDNSLLEPIKLYEGKILDGRNRYLACKEAKKPLSTDVYDGDDPVGFVISLNLQRRHLTESQLAIVCADLESLGVGRPPRAKAKAEEVIALWTDDQTLTQAEIADKVGISQQSVARILTDANVLLKNGQNCTILSKKSKKPKLTTEDMATLRKVSARSIKSARMVKRKGNAQLSKAVKDGHLPVDKAASVAKQSDDFIETFLNNLQNGDVKPTEAMRLTHRDLLPKKIAALPEDKFRVIYADPPWAYNDARQTGDNRETTGVDAHYASMPLEDIKAMDVKSLAAPDSVLLMWGVFPLLPEVLEVIEAWGFKYKTAFVWDKERTNFGSYHDARAEILLIGTRGSCTPEIDQKEKQVQSFPRTKHSAKPEEWRNLIDRLWPSGPRIELFHRGTGPEGWTTWGGQSDV